MQMEKGENMRLINIDRLPNIEVKATDGQEYLLLPYKHLSDVPTVNAIEREKLDKAIEEIENLFDESLSEAPCTEMQFRCGLTRAREILERNIIGDNNE